MFDCEETQVQKVNIINFFFSFKCLITKRVDHLVNNIVCTMTFMFKSQSATYSIELMRLLHLSKSLKQFNYSSKQTKKFEIKITNQIRASSETFVIFNTCPSTLNRLSGWFLFPRPKKSWKLVTLCDEKCEDFFVCGKRLNNNKVYFLSMASLFPHISPFNLKTYRSKWW